MVAADGGRVRSGKLVPPAAEDTAVPRVRTLVYADKLIARAAAVGYPPTRLTQVVLDACLESLNGRTRALPPSQAELDAAVAEAAAVNAAGVTAQVTFLLGSVDDCDDALESRADEILESIELEPLRQAALPPPRTAAANPLGVRIDITSPPDMTTAVVVMTKPDGTREAVDRRSFPTQDEAVAWVRDYNTLVSSATTFATLAAYFPTPTV